MNHFLRWTYAVLAGLLLGMMSSAGRSAETAPPSIPALILIGDSTVNNSTRGLQGWGTPLRSWFNPAAMRVENRAAGGRSSRSFLREGLWSKVLAELRPGDFLLIQFGHNDGGPIDSEKARASLKGSGPETLEVTIKESGAKETVRTYGSYLRLYISEAKAKDVRPIVLSPVPRNIWKDGKVARNANDYGKWAAEAAKAEDVPFVDLNEIVARRYDAASEARVAAEYFTSVDHTHTTPVGAALNAECLVCGLRALPGDPLAKYVVLEPASPPLSRP